MTTTAAVPRIVLDDRLAGQLDWRRNGGNATDAYTELVAGLHPMIRAIQGHDNDIVDDAGEIVLSDDVLEAIGRILVDRIEQLGCAR